MRRESSQKLSKGGLRCDMCGGLLREKGIGYLRARGQVELALCYECLRDYAEYVTSNACSKTGLIRP